MSLVERTKDYATEVALTALNAFDRQGRGDLEAPNGDENVRLFTAKGGSAVTLSSTTTSAAVVYDPESTLRNGQLAAMIYERNSANKCTNVQRVTLGRSTDEFLSAGILSSGLKVFNSSGVDVIGGTQSAAVLTSVPRDISTVTTTDIANFCSNHNRDLVSGVVSREDSTLTMAMTEHFGKKMALTRKNTLGNVIQRTWDEGISSRRTTSGSTFTFDVDTTMDIGATTRTDAEILADTDAGAALRLVDTDRLDGDKNPLTLACFRADVDVTALILDPDATDASQFMMFVILGLNAAGTVISRREVQIRMSVTDNHKFAFRVSGTASSDSEPLARVVVGGIRTVGDISDKIVAAETSGVITAYEETSDISARPIHVCVLEGINASATLNISTTAVITGVPDSSNVFISTRPDNESAVVDSNAVEMFLKSMTRVLPRAFTVGGHSIVDKKVRAMYGDEAVMLAFKAMSFGDVGKAIKKVGLAAKAAAPQVKALLEEALPVIGQYGEMASMLPGPVGRAGAMASGMARSMH
jgi:hypothetical protein